MPGELKDLIERINDSESDKISYLIVDAHMGEALEVAEKMGIKRAAFWSVSAALFALAVKNLSLIDDRIKSSDGCLIWLDQQPYNSIIYVVFGSFTIFDQNQFQELALGLEITNRPFLWVVQQNITEDLDNAYPTGFKERVRHHGQMVSWAPQQKLLSHPSIACFISHCGWNSTVEGISNGIPFLCWPYFPDQVFNQSYICDYLKIGLKLNKYESGIIRHEEINNKLEQVFDEEGSKERAFYLQTKILNGIRGGGSSYKNFNDFAAWIND